MAGEATTGMSIVDKVGLLHRSPTSRSLSYDSNIPPIAPNNHHWKARIVNIHRNCLFGHVRSLGLPNMNIRVSTQCAMSILFAHHVQLLMHVQAYGFFLASLSLARMETTPSNYRTPHPLPMQKL